MKNNKPRLSPYAVPGILHYDTPELFMIKVLNVLGINVEDITRKSKNREFVEIRALITHMMATKYPYLKNYQIGNIIGGYSGRLVHYYIRTVNNQLDVNRNYKQNYISIMKML